MRANSRSRDDFRRFTPRNRYRTRCTVEDDIIYFTLLMGIASGVLFLYLWVFNWVVRSVRGENRFFRENRKWERENTV